MGIEIRNSTSELDGYNHESSLPAGNIIIDESFSDKEVAAAKGILDHISMFLAGQQDNYYGAFVSSERHHMAILSIITSYYRREGTLTFLQGGMSEVIRGGYNREVVLKALGDDGEPIHTWILEGREAVGRALDKTTLDLAAIVFKEVFDK